MIRHDIEEKLAEKYERDGYFYPDYDSYCFSKIMETGFSVVGKDVEEELPETVFEDVDTSGIENFVFVLVDGFGHEEWKDFSDQHEFFASFNRNGAVSPLTSIYPSETSAALTSINTGLTTDVHGLIGWNVYLEDRDLYFQPLPYTTDTGERVDEIEKYISESGERGNEIESDPPTLFEGKTVYEKYSVDSETGSYGFQYDSMIESVYTKAVLEGSERVGCMNPADIALNIRKKLESSEGKNVFYAYIPEIDKVSHEYGTRTDEYQTQLRMVSDALRNELGKLDDEIAEKTLVAVGADHGHIDVGRDEGIDLLKYDEVVESLKERKDGSKVMPSGSARNTHLHLKPGGIEQVRDRLKAEMGDDLLVFTKEEAIETGLFGRSEPSEIFEPRIGDLILVHRDKPVWHSREEGSLKKRGYHGGLNREEMLVPFGVGKLSELGF